VRPSKTHFEQVPVEMVKMIAKELPPEDATGDDSVSVEWQKQATSPREHWREVAEKIKEERDPNSMIALVQQLITSFDEERQARRHGSTDRQASPKSRSDCP
jgi:hypothetical protein